MRSASFGTPKPDMVFGLATRPELSFKQVDKISGLRWDPRPWDMDQHEKSAWRTDDQTVSPLNSAWERTCPVRKDHLLYETEDERNYRMQTTSFNKSKKQGQLYDVHPCTRRGLELGGTAGGVEMRQTSMDFGANDVLQRKSMVPDPYRDGVHTSRPIGEEKKTHRYPKPAHVDRNRSAVKTMAIPFENGLDPYDTARWKTDTGGWTSRLEQAAWASKQPKLTVPNRWHTTTKASFTGKAEAAKAWI